MIVVLWARKGGVYSSLTPFYFYILIEKSDIITCIIKINDNMYQKLLLRPIVCVYTCTCAANIVEKI